MQYLPTLIWRHRKENLKKCSLRGLESREDMIFIPYPTRPLPPLDNYILLTLDAPPLCEEDNKYGLLLLDGTWAYAERMRRQIPKDAPLIYRSIPSWVRTAYPRVQDDCEDPERGLASVEALYIAYQLMGRDTTGLLDNYYWKDKFLVQGI